MSEAVRRFVISKHGVEAVFLGQIVDSDFDDLAYLKPLTSESLDHVLEDNRSYDARRSLNL